MNRVQALAPYRQLIKSSTSCERTQQPIGAAALSAPASVGSPASVLYALLVRAARTQAHVIARAAPPRHRSRLQFELSCGYGTRIDRCLADLAPATKSWNYWRSSGPGSTCTLVPWVFNSTTPTTSIPRPVTPTPATTGNATGDCRVS